MKDSIPATKKTRENVICKLLSINNFTLIELLVTISIIAILASMLLPALSKAREIAKSSKCSSNCKQIAAATLFYANDYNDYVPPQQDFKYVTWHARLKNYIPNTVVFLKCPSFRDEYRVAAWKTDYGWNHAGNNQDGMGYDLVNMPCGGYVKLNLVKSPSQFIMFGDARDRMTVANRTADQPIGAFGQRGVYIAAGGAYDGVPSLHSGGCNVGFADGHVQYGKMLYWHSPVNAKLWSRYNK